MGNVLAATVGDKTWANRQRSRLVSKCLQHDQSLHQFFLVIIRFNFNSDPYLFSFGDFHSLELVYLHFQLPILFIYRHTRLEVDPESLLKSGDIFEETRPALLPPAPIHQTDSQRTPGPGSWERPGPGRRLAGERAAAAARREVTRTDRSSLAAILERL